MTIYTPTIGDKVTCRWDRGWLGTMDVRCEVVADSNGRPLIVCEAYGRYFDAADVIFVERPDGTCRGRSFDRAGRPIWVSIPN